MLSLSYTPENISHSRWPYIRADFVSQLITTIYGDVSEFNGSFKIEKLHQNRIQELGSYTNYRFVFGEHRDLVLSFRLYRPDTEKSVPVVIHGDGCWVYMTIEMIQHCLKQKCALIVFDRTELYPDVVGQGDIFSLQNLIPGEYGAIAAWAWGYSKIVDFVLQQDDLDTAHISVSGHSRGGKATLLAGALDERISCVHANNSGCCGAGSFHHYHEGAEQLANILAAFPYWFKESLQDYIGRDAEMPIDLDLLKAAVAPRRLFTTEGREDLWANPEGTRITHEQAKTVYEQLGVKDHIQYVLRDGGHAYTMQDFKNFLKFFLLKT